MQQEKYPEKCQDDHQEEKLVWDHGVPPSYGVIQGVLYPVFGGRELAADWRYTTKWGVKSRDPGSRRHRGFPRIVPLGGPLVHSRAPDHSMTQRGPTPCHGRMAMLNGRPLHPPSPRGVP